MEIDEPAQRRDQDRAFVVCKSTAVILPAWTRGGDGVGNGIDRGALLAGKPRQQIVLADR